MKAFQDYYPENLSRCASSPPPLFDGHDASINIMRRILQSPGAEVIHLGHNRSVEEIVNAALQEDVQGIAVTSYQGGHVEFFKYMIDLLRGAAAATSRSSAAAAASSCRGDRGAACRYGVTRIYSPEDGQRLGLQGMINEVVAACDVDLGCRVAADQGAGRRSPANGAAWPGHHRGWRTAPRRR
jgi:methylmalonyl-CoA mutase